MKKFRVKSVERHNNHLLLTLTPKSDSQRLSFWPGQYATIGYKRNGQRSPMRCFSMVNSPSNAELQFAMWPDGQFTSQLANLAPGTEMRVQGPFGEFVIDSQYDKNIIMLAAGIGITPFISMLRYAAEINSQVPIMLIYACRKADDIPFYDEIRRLQTLNPKIRAIFVVSQGENNPDKGIFKGRINEGLLQKITNQSFQGYTYFICGPKSFMQGQQSILEKNSVDENRIVSESFTQGKKLGWKFSGMSIPSLTYTATALTFAIGFVGIMVMDLIRYTPKNTATITTPNSNSTSNSASTDDSSNSSSSSANTTTPTTTQSTPTQQNYYQTPVSSVS